MNCAICDMKICDDDSTLPASAPWKRCPECGRLICEDCYIPHRDACFDCADDLAAN